MAGRVSCCFYEPMQDFCEHWPLYILADIWRIREEEEERGGTVM